MCEKMRERERERLEFTPHIFQPHKFKLGAENAKISTQSMINNIFFLQSPLLQRESLPNVYIFIYASTCVHSKDPDYLFLNPKKLKLPIN